MQRNAGGDVESNNLFVADAVEVLDERTQRIAVCGDQNRAAQLEVRNDLVVPVRQQSLDDILEAFSARNGRTQVCVASFACLRPFRAVVEFRRRGVERTTPRHELLFTEFVAHFGLVLTLQGTVVAFVQTPGALDIDPGSISGFQCQVRCDDGALQARGVQDIGSESRFYQQLTGPGGFGAALISEGYVNPAGEEVLLVPFAFAVAQQHEVVSHISILPCGGGLRRLHPQGRR